MLFFLGQSKNFSGETDGVLQVQYLLLILLPLENKNFSGETDGVLQVQYLLLILLPIQNKHLCGKTNNVLLATNIHQLSRKIL